jgi:hypothetical protein
MVLKTRKIKYNVNVGPATCPGEKKNALLNHIHDFGEHLMRIDGIR